MINFEINAEYLQSAYCIGSIYDRDNPEFEGMFVDICLYIKKLLTLSNEKGILSKKILSYTFDISPHPQQMSYFKNVKTLSPYFGYGYIKKFEEDFYNNKDTKLEKQTQYPIIMYGNGLVKEPLFINFYDYFEITTNSVLINNIEFKNSDFYNDDSWEWKDGTPFYVRTHNDFEFLIKRGIIFDFEDFYVISPSIFRKCKQEEIQIKNKKGCIYFLTSKTQSFKTGFNNLVKIGRTNNTIHKRIKSINKEGVGGINDWELYKFIETENTINLESKIHKHFNQFRHIYLGECFEIDPEKAFNEAKSLI